MPPRRSVPLTRLLARSLACAGCVNLPACSEPPSPTRGEGKTPGGEGENSILRLIEERFGLDPRHHRAELFADVLDRMLRELGARRLERGLVDLVLEHPVAGEAAGLDIGEDL